MATKERPYADTLVAALFAAAGNPRIEKVSLGAAGTYYLRSAPSDVRDVINAMMQRGDKDPESRRGLRTLTICASLCDSAGLRMQYDDALRAALADLEPALIEPLYEAAMKVNFAWRSEEELDAAEKNSAATGGGKPGSS